jgi:dTDP-4-dehydrorhamnose reductase
MASEKILIVGIDSTIGRALAATLSRQGRDVIGTSRRPAAASGATLFLDLAQDMADWQPPSGISVAVLAAGMDQRQCVLDPERARRVNVDHLLLVSRRLLATGARVVFPSTNLVFACDRPDQPANSGYQPLNLYAALKAEVEQRLLETGGNVALCRLAKLLTIDLPLIAGWLRDLAADRPISAFSDLNVAPVSLSYTIEFMTRVMASAETGIFQISGAEEQSYCNFARALARGVGRPEALVRCCTSQEAGIDLPASPRHPSLNASRTNNVLGLAPQPVHQVIDELVKAHESEHAIARN